MTAGIYTAIGFGWARVGGPNGVLHLVPRTIAPRSTTPCGKRVADVAVFWERDQLVPGGQRCIECSKRNGTAGPARDGRIERMGQ